MGERERVNTDDPAEWPYVPRKKTERNRKTETGEGGGFSQDGQGRLHRTGGTERSETGEVVMQTVGEAH